MAFHFPALPKFDRLTALYRHRKSLDLPPGPLPPETSSSPRLVNQLSMSLTTKGLLNPTGENNCFLNSAVQVLWHIGVFRRSFREVKGHHCVGKSCIFCSLKFLFSEFQHDTGHSAIPPDQLRQSLALCYEGQRRFQLGLMDDAAECFANCKQNVVIKRILLNSPDVFSLGLIWDSASPSVDDIMGVVSNIGQTLQLNEVFDHVFSDSAHCNELQLTALIAYYGRHYSTFCFHSKQKQWIYFDDAKFRTIGADWSMVCDLIRKAHYQPLLLVYSNDFGENVDLSDAPIEIILTPESPKVKDLPTLEESPEEIELANQIAEEEATVSNAGMAAAGDSPSHTIDPMTLSIIPSARANTTQSQGTSSNSDLMMFSLSPAITGKPHSSAESAGSKPSSGVSQTSLSPSHSTPSQPHKPEQRSTPHTAPQAPTHGTTTHSSTVTQSHGNVAHSPTHSHTRENAPHTVSHPHTQGSTALTPTPDPQSIVRPRPRSNSSGSKPQIRINLKSQVSIEETKVQAQQHHFQGDDLMAFSLAPSVFPSPKTASPSISSPQGPEDVSTESGQDLIQFSITPNEVARLSKKSPNTVPSSHRYGNRSHDSHMASGLNIKWDHFASDSVQQQTNFGIAPDESLPKIGAPPNDSTTSPAVKQLRRMASIPDQPSQLGGKVTSPSGNPPQQVGKHPPAMGQVGRVPAVDSSSSTVSRPTRDLPEIPIPQSRPQVSTCDQTGTYVELDFNQQPHGQSQVQRSRPVAGGKGKEDDHLEYAEISFTSKRAEKSDNAAQGQSQESHTSTVPSRDSTQPISEDPLYAVPDQVKRKIRLKEGDVGALPESVTSQLAEARDLLAKAQSVRGSDDTVGLMVLAQYKSILDKVLRDPVVSSSAKLSQQIRAKLEEGTKLYNELKPQGSRSESATLAKVHGRCSQCGRLRDLDARQKLCGPCHIISQKASYGSQASAIPSRDSSQPISEDPLYAVPEQVKRKTRLKQGDAGALPESVTSQLAEARDLLAKAQSVRGSDDVVGLMLLAQYKSILDKVLRDPVVSSSAKLSQRIRTKLEEGTKLYNELKPQGASASAARVHGRCSRCGQLRDLDPSQKLCGPCALRVRIES